MAARNLAYSLNNLYQAHNNVRNNAVIDMKSSSFKLVKMGSIAFYISVFMYIILVL